MIFLFINSQIAVHAQAPISFPIPPASEIRVLLNDSSIIVAYLDSATFDKLYVNVKNNFLVAIKKTSILEVNILSYSKVDILTLKNGNIIEGSIRAYDAKGIWIRISARNILHVFYENIQEQMHEINYVGEKRNIYAAPTSPLIIMFPHAFPTPRKRLLLTNHFFNEHMFSYGEYNVYKNINIGLGLILDKPDVFFLNLRKSLIHKPYVGVSYGLLISSLFHHFRYYSINELELNDKQLFPTRDYSKSYGMIYGATSVGTPKRNFTGLLGYELQAEDILHFPVLGLNGIYYVGRYFALVTENWFLPLDVTYTYRAQAVLKEIKIINYPRSIFGLRLSWIRTDWNFNVILPYESDFMKRDIHFVFGITTKL